MTRKLLFALLLTYTSSPAFAGHGTIKETDTEIIVEYSGDANDELAAKLLRDERLKAEANEEKRVEHVTGTKEMKDAQRAKNRKEEEE